MGKKTEKKLKRKIAKLKRKLDELSAQEHSTDISPLAPINGFPNLPVIDGVRFSVVEAGVKYSGRPDVMLAELSAGTVIAGTFTKSVTRSAPVLDCQKKIGLPYDGGAAILVNSGNANAFTGSHGEKSVSKITTEVAKILKVDPNRVFTASTGVIGESLAHDKVIDRLNDLKASLSPTSASDAASAIMTTDTFSKGSFAKIGSESTAINIAGFAKGSGMIAPDMATMLVYIFTDAKISQPLLQEMVSSATNCTFNCITVDTDTSTSDTLLVAATGKSAADEIQSFDSDLGQEFYQALHGVMLDLAHQVIRDGEGATKFIQVQVTGAESDDDAHLAALSIANSPLVKTAVAGEDPNWGRIVMAVGKSGANANRDLLSIRLGDILVADKGWVFPDYSEECGAAYMKNQDIEITVDLGIGSSEATVWTCDLTHGYITINADYRS